MLENCSLYMEIIMIGKVVEHGTMVMMDLTLMVEKEFLIIVGQWQLINMLMFLVQTLKEMDLRQYLH